MLTFLNLLMIPQKIWGNTLTVIKAIMPPCTWCCRISLLHFLRLSVQARSCCDTGSKSQHGSVGTMCKLFTQRSVGYTPQHTPHADPSQQQKWLGILDIRRLFNTDIQELQLMLRTCCGRLILVRSKLYFTQVTFSALLWYDCSCGNQTQSREILFFPP